MIIRQCGGGGVWQPPKVCGVSLLVIDKTRAVIDIIIGTEILPHQTTLN